MEMYPSFIKGTTIMRLFIILFFIFVHGTAFSKTMGRQYEIIKNPETGDDEQIYITGTKIKKRDDGSILYTMSLKDGYQDGLTIKYFANGLVEEELSLRKGAFSGYNKRYARNGQLRLLSYYVDNKKQGEEIIYRTSDSGRSVQSINNYNQGFKDGIQKSFNADGILRQSTSYQANIEGRRTALHGPKTYYYKKGNVRQISSFVNGQLHGLMVYYHENGLLEKEVCFQDNKKLKGLEPCKGKGKKQEIIKVFFADGSIKDEFQVEDGKLNGFNRSYYENGQLAVDSHYLNNHLDATKKKYTSKGIITESTQWKEGSKHGEAKLFFPTGQLSYKKTYKNGILDGNISSYYSNGNLYHTGILVGGKRQGYFKYYTKENVLYRDSLYKDGKLQLNQYYLENGLIEECEYNEDYFVACETVKPGIAL